MHDLTFAKEIINAVNNKVKNLEYGAKIAVVNASLSPLSHVKPETLKETFAALVKGTPLERLTLNVKALKLAMKCASCKKSFTVDKPTFLCPECHSKDITIVNSSEFRVDSVEVAKTA
jgi:Zn finger protein HypA/HybF (possibly regulating hydrogenase expression)